MTSIPIPVSFATRKKPWALIALVLGGVAVLGLAIYMLANRRSATDSGTYYTVQPMDLDVTIKKDQAELQAANNVDIVCPVEGLSTIKDIVKEGVFVHKGDVVVQFDSSEIERKMETATLDLQKAQADVTAARESKEIQESTNAANLEAANVDLIVARLGLQEYIGDGKSDGKYVQQLDTAKTAVEMAQIEVGNKEEDLTQNKALYSKNFVTAVNVKDAEVALLKAKNELRGKENDLKVLEKYTHEKELTDLKSKVVQAEKKLARTERENASNLAQKLASMQASEQALTLRKQQFEHLQEQLTFCTLKAPADGMVVYGTSGSSSWGRRDTPIQAGAQVRQQELLIRLPDTSQMKAVARVQEMQVNKLRVDPQNPVRASVKIVGLEKTIGGSVTNISIMADQSGRWFGSDTKEYPIDVTLDETPPNLKPGTTVELQIFVERLKNVLAVSQPCIYAAGRDSYVFVRDGEKHTPVKVVIGATSDTHAEVKQGLNAGQEVLILQAGQGRELLEQAGVNVTPATQPAVAEKEPRPMRPQAAGTETNTNTGSTTDGSANAPRRTSGRRPKPADPVAGAATAPATP